MKYVLYSSNPNAGFEFENWVWDKHYEYAVNNGFSLNEVEGDPNRWEVKTSDMVPVMDFLLNENVQKMLGEFSFSMGNC